MLSAFSSFRTERERRFRQHLPPGRRGLRQVSAGAGSWPQVRATAGPPGAGTRLALLRPSTVSSVMSYLSRRSLTGFSRKQTSQMTALVICRLRNSASWLSCRLRVAGGRTGRAARGRPCGIHDGPGRAAKPTAAAACLSVFLVLGAKEVHV